jgi:hypothetical protein
MTRICSCEICGCLLRLLLLSCQLPEEDSCDLAVCRSEDSCILTVCSKQQARE